ncbi:hypothetical protein HN358_00930 [Candidatus Uhrbacteria bacterium]|nr:hypothetical protein [Candidatus Uhrbacteria bacterium]MBT7717449.1 hypothetical protein [Candidatus Uhrbacteria bacterium]
MPQTEESQECMGVSEFVNAVHIMLALPKLDLPEDAKSVGEIQEVLLENGWMDIAKRLRLTVRKHGESEPDYRGPYLRIDSADGRIRVTISDRCPRPETNDWQRWYGDVMLFDISDSHPWRHDDQIRKFGCHMWQDGQHPHQVHCEPNPGQRIMYLSFWPSNVVAVPDHDVQDHFKWARFRSQWGLYMDRIVNVVGEYFNEGDSYTEAFLKCTSVE